jgi:hypothetical protein
MTRGIAESTSAALNSQFRRITPVTRSMPFSDQCDDVVPGATAVAPAAGL